MTDTDFEVEALAGRKGPAAPAPDYQTKDRMAAKLRAIPLPDLYGKRVLDIGCDFGFWSFLAAKSFATDVLGIDRNRVVKGVGPVDLIEMNRTRAFETGVTACRFEKIELGKQWPMLGQFDVILMLSVYHHIFEACGGQHGPVWYWLWHHCAPDGEILWEGPVGDDDPVVKANVSHYHHEYYTRDLIFFFASLYFTCEFIGPALHEPTRSVWRLKPKAKVDLTVHGAIVPGAGGATAAFEYANGRRIAEIETILGVRCLPGSLNLGCSANFWWGMDYYSAPVLDVVERGRGLEGEWKPRIANFYPVRVSGQDGAPVDAFAFRFAGEKYDANFVELIAPVRLRDCLKGARVTLCN